MLGVAAHNLAREEGVIVRGIRDLVALSPPLVVTHEELARMFDSLARGLDRLFAGR
jgi:adenosylmethionine-8-amino-7-oxononanoate aminotransferase